MPRSTQLVVEVHFVPLPEADRDERSQRLFALLLRGALRVVPHHRDRIEAAERLEVERIPENVFQQ